MAVKSVTEWVEARSASDGSDGVITAQRVFRVRTDDKENDGVFTVLNAVDPVTGLRIPIPGSLYAFGSEVALAAVKKRNTRQDGDDPLLWLVDVNYEYNPKDGQQPPPESGPPNPFLKPALIAYATDPREKVFDKDRDGKDVLNSAFQPFDPPILIANNNWKAVVTKNVPYIGGGFIEAWANTVNQSAFQGVAAKRLLLSAINASPIDDSYWGIYHQLQCEFSYNSERDWEPVKVGDFGKYELDPSLTFLIPCTDKFNRDVSEPVKLNGSGIQSSPNAATTYLSFKAYRLVDFSGLGLF